MKASVLIEKLKDLMSKRGDREVHLFINHEVDGETVLTSVTLENEEFLLSDYVFGSRRVSYILCNQCGFQGHANSHQCQIRFERPYLHTSNEFDLLMQINQKLSIIIEELKKK